MVYRVVGGSQGWERGLEVQGEKEGLRVFGIVARRFPGEAGIATKFPSIFGMN